MCQKAGVGHTTLTPYIDAELLSHTHLAVDGAAPRRGAAASNLPVTRVWPGTLAWQRSVESSAGACFVRAKERAVETKS